MAKTSAAWFEVDKAGLARKLARKHKGFVVGELVQNAWDAEGVSRVDFGCTFHNGTIKLSARDNSPVGFVDIKHAYTLFAPSVKERDCTRRGRFNIGEKLIFALCDRAKVETTTGTILFWRGGRKVLHTKTTSGTIISCLMPGTKQDFDEMLAFSRRLLVPKGIETFVNGELLPSRLPELTFPARLTTEAANDAGELRAVNRMTEVSLHLPAPGETAWVYEMGIPVQETEDKWHYDVAQKVPLSLDREAVRPKFLKAVRLAVFNAAYDRLNEEDCNRPWVQEALEQDGSKAEAVEDYTRKRFSVKRVAYDPSDREANHLAVSKGYEVVHGNALSKKMWKRLKEVGAILPAGKVTPSPKPFHPDAPPYKVLAAPSPEMCRVAEYAKALAREVLGCTISVTFADDPAWFPAAVYGQSQHLIFNVGQLGTAWFDLSEPETVNRERINRLLIHEWGHHYESNHLSAEYHEALCKVAAKLVELAAASKLPPL
jgi:hypothetical protein